MKAQIEPISAVIRVWENDDANYGEPYEWTATMRWIRPGEAEILAYTNRVTPSIWKAIRKEVQNWKLKRILAVTFVDGIRTEKWIPVPSPFESLYR